MTRIAFLIENEHHFGGINYIKNLLFAIKMVGDLSIELYVFCGIKTSASIVEQFKKLASVVQSPYFDGQTLQWYHYTKLFEYTGLLYPINKLMKSYGIDIVSHSNIYGCALPYKTIFWLPDFQFLRLPMMFSSRDKRKEKKRFKNAIRLSDRLIISSYDAQNDLETHYSGNLEKSRVLQFVVQPDRKVYEITREQGLEIEKRYKIYGKYFYIPNQFWKHKNHMIVFEAVNILKKKGLDLLLLCSGDLMDFRRIHKKYPQDIHNYLTSNNLTSNVYLLGIIPYEHVVYFIRNSVAVINPSFCEGWHTGVEEAKSIGKKIILSNINVHFEQNPPEASYFDPRDANELANIMQFQWENTNGGPDLLLESQARGLLDTRIIQFGKNYLSYLADL